MKILALKILANGRHPARNACKSQLLFGCKTALNVTELPANGGRTTRGAQRSQLLLSRQVTLLVDQDGLAGPDDDSRASKGRWIQLALVYASRCTQGRELMASKSGSRSCAQGYTYYYLLPSKPSRLSLSTEWC